MSAWRLEFAVQANAQSLADRTHTWMVANDSEYARSVGAGQTLRWAIPYFDTTVWCTNIKTRSFNSLSGPERSAVKVLA